MLVPQDNRNHDIPKRIEDPGKHRMNMYGFDAYSLHVLFVRVLQVVST